MKKFFIILLIILGVLTGANLAFAAPTPTGFGYTIIPTSSPASVKLSWAIPKGNFTAFTLYRSEDPNTLGKKMGEYYKKSKFIIDYSVLPNHTYYYVLKTHLGKTFSQPSKKLKVPFQITSSTLAAANALAALPITQIVPAANDTCVNSQDFKMLVLIDSATVSTTDSQIRSYFTEASNLLYDRTNKHICVPKNGIIKFVFTSDEKLTFDIIKLMKSASQLIGKMNGFTIFTNNSKTANAFGGYATSFDLNGFGLNNYCNSFSSKETNRFIYGSVINPDHMYARCGYNDSLQHISNISLDGECVKTPGTSCVLHNGYYMCSNLLNNYYASDVNIFTISSIIHEIIHHYGENGNMDHYGTSVCNTYPVPPKMFSCPSSNDAECYFGMCPYTYLKFKNAVNTCSK